MPPSILLRAGPALLPGTDILFRIQTASGSPAEIYLLFVHKSQRDPRIFAQLLSYLARIYERQDKPVPIIPFVFYHAKKVWDLGTDFAAHFTFSEAERQIFASEQKKLEKLRKLIFYVLTRGEIPHEKVVAVLSSVSRSLTTLPFSLTCKSAT